MRRLHALQIDSEGWLEGVRRVPSPFCDDRPEGELSLLVVHNISLPPGKFGGGYVEKLFTGTLDPKADPYFEQIAGMRVSSHCFIDRQGSVTQFVPFLRRAWHAGVSHYEGREKCNDFSIGIELEGTDHEPYEDAQYEALSSLMAEFIRVYPEMSIDRMTGHCDIAPERKTDPGEAFYWERFRKLVAEKSGSRV